MMQIGREPSECKEEGTKIQIRQGRVSASSSSLFHVQRVAPWNKADVESDNDSSEYDEVDSGLVECMAFACQVCGLLSENKLDLLVHVSTTHQACVPSVAPENVPVNLNNQLNQKSRQDSCDSKDSTFECSVCGKMFSHRGSLKAHKDSIHAGKKPFACNQCDRRFARKLTLTRHMQVHTGEKPFQCHICRKKLSRKHILKQHLLTHSRSLRMS